MQTETAKGVDEKARAIVTMTEYLKTELNFKNETVLTGNVEDEKAGNMMKTTICGI